MDLPQYNNLIDALRHVPDPRKARGKRFEWHFLLGLIAVALLCQQRSPRAIAQWASHHRRTLLAYFRPRSRRIPSEATLLRTLRHVDITALEAHLAQFTQAQLAAQQPPLSPSPALKGVAVDGKTLRGAQAHGAPTHLVSLVPHGTSQVVAQLAVPHKRNEISAVPLLLSGRSLTGWVVTMDALLTQRKLAAQILEQGGQYLMVVKRNHRQLYAECSWFFQAEPLTCELPWQEAERTTKGHGRLETRQVSCTADLDGYLTWPGVQQVVRRTCERLLVKTGEVTRTVTYGLTSLPSTAAGAEQIAQLWQGHWGIENGVHYVRDVTMGEDSSQVHTGHAPQALAALRNAVLSLLRRESWQTIPDGLRYYQSHLPKALRLVGLTRS